MGVLRICLHCLLFHNTHIDYLKTTGDTGRQHRRHARTQPRPSTAARVFLTVPRGAYYLRTRALPVDLVNMVCSCDRNICCW